MPVAASSGGGDDDADMSPAPDHDPPLEDPMTVDGAEPADHVDIDEDDAQHPDADEQGDAPMQPVPQQDPVMGCTFLRVASRWFHGGFIVVSWWFHFHGGFMLVS